MTTIAKKLILQTFLLVAFILIFFLVDVGIAGPIGLYDSLFGFLAIFIYLWLVILIPISVLYFIRKSNYKNLGKLFRFMVYSSAFILLAFFLTTFISTSKYVYTAFLTYDEQYLKDLDQGVLQSLTYILLAVLMYVIARVNKSLDEGEKITFIPRLRNLKLVVAVTSMILVLIVSFYTWYQASKYTFLIESLNFSSSSPELTQAAVRDAYDLAFKKIILIGGFVFISAFLLIKTLPKKHDNNQ